jgi:hypothetical protein
MTIDESIARLCGLRKRLDAGQGRGARSNARRAVLGALRSVRYALDAEYPILAKPHKPKARPSGPYRARLPFRRAFDVRTARLFARLAGETFGLPVPKLEAHPVARKWASAHKHNCFFRTDWPDYLKWLQLLHSFHQGRRDLGELLVELWGRFWSEQIPTTDVQAAAEQLAIIERAAKRTDAARRATSNRKARAES